MISMVSLLTLRSFKPETSGPPTSFYFPYDNALKINRIPAIKELPTIDTVLPSSTMLYALSFSAISCIFCIFIFLASSHQHSTSFFATYSPFFFWLFIVSGLFPFLPWAYVVCMVYDMIYMQKIWISSFCVLTRYRAMVLPKSQRTTTIRIHVREIQGHNQASINNAR